MNDFSDTLKAGGGGEGVIEYNNIFRMTIYYTKYNLCGILYTKISYIRSIIYPCNMCRHISNTH